MLYNKELKMSRWNPNRYSARTLSVFEITGAYFANIFYNHLYKTAKDRHNISSRSGYSLTDEYKSAVSAYKHGITEDKKSYEQTVKDLLQYYRTVTKFITASMNDFIDTILQQFIPEEHFVTLNDNEKFFFMNKILSTIVTNTASKMVSMKYLGLVIDNRGDDMSISTCKEKIVKIQCLERDNMFSKFIKQEIGGSNNRKMRSKQHKELLEECEKVDIKLVSQLRQDCETLYQKYQELLMSKCELEAAENRAKKIVETLHDEIFKLSEENSILKKKLAGYSLNSGNKGADSTRQKVKSAEPIRAKPAEKSAEKSLDKSAEKSVDRSLEKSAEKQVEKSVDKSVDKSLDKSAEKQVEKSMQKKPLYSQPQRSEQNSAKSSKLKPVPEQIPISANVSKSSRRKVQPFAQPVVQPEQIAEESEHSDDSVDSIASAESTESFTFDNNNHNNADPADFDEYEDNVFVQDLE